MQAPSDYVRRAEDAIGDAYKDAREVAKETYQQIKVGLDEFATKLTQLWNEGNARRVVIKNKNNVEVAAFPLLAGGVIAVLSSVVAAVAVFVSLYAGCSIFVETVETKEASEEPISTNQTQPRSKEMPPHEL